MKRIVRIVRALITVPVGSVGVAALVVAASGVASRVLGLVRDRVLAARFGAGDTLDVYYAAFRIPDAIFELLVIGALSAAFVPVFTKLVSSGRRREAQKLAERLTVIFFCAIFVIACVLFLFLPFIVPYLVPGFSVEKQYSVTHFSRILLLSPFFLGLSAIFGGILLSLKRFAAFALAPVVYNIGIIIGAVFLVPIFGSTGLVWGVVAGSIFHLIVQIPAVTSAGFFPRLRLDRVLSDRNVRRVLRLMVPRVFATASNQFALLITTFFASTLSSGSVAAFSFATNIQSVPLGLVGIPLAVASFPAFSQYYARGQRAKFAHTLSKTLRRVLFVVVPLSVLIILLRAQIVRVTLGTGRFDWEDTRMTFGILGVLAASVWAQSTVPVLARAFYAMENTRTPFFIALLSQAFYIVLVAFLIGDYGILGVAAAFSVAAVVNVILLIGAVRIRLKRFDTCFFMDTIWKVVVATVFMTIVVQGVKYAIGIPTELDTFVDVFTQLVVAGLSGLAAYAAASWALNIREYRVLAGKAFGRLQSSFKFIKNI